MTAVAVAAVKKVMVLKVAGSSSRAIMELARLAQELDTLIRELKSD